MENKTRLVLGFREVTEVRFKSESGAFKRCFVSISEAAVNLNDRLSVKYP